MVQLSVCFPSGSALSTDYSAQGPCHVGRALSAGWLGCCATQPEKDWQKHLLQQVPCPNLFCSALSTSLCLSTPGQVPPLSLHQREREEHAQHLLPTRVSACFLLRFHTSAHRSAARWGLGLLFCCSVDRKRRQTNAVAMQMWRFRRLSSGKRCILGWKIKGNLVCANRSRQL